MSDTFTTTDGATSTSTVVAAYGSFVTDSASPLYANLAYDNPNPYSCSCCDPLPRIQTNVLPNGSTTIEKLR